MESCRENACLEGGVVEEMEVLDDDIALIWSKTSEQIDAMLAAENLDPHRAIAAVLDLLDEKVEEVQALAQE